MSTDAAIIGISDHAGWAVVVTVAGDATVLDRRRVELLDAALPCMPYHHEAQALPLDEALDLVARVRAAAERHAKHALDAVAAAVPQTIRGVALRACPELPATVEERLKSYWAQNRADGVMYRQALAGAAEARGWSVAWYDAKTVLDEARAVVADLDARFAAVRASLGPPWRKDHRTAMAAAIVADV